MAALSWEQFLHLISHTSDSTFLASSQFVSIARVCSRFSLPDAAHHECKAVSQGQRLQLGHTDPVQQ